VVFSLLQQLEALGLDLPSLLKQMGTKASPVGESAAGQTPAWDREQQEAAPGAKSQSPG
jgi:hypothetical protein